MPSYALIHAPMMGHPYITDIVSGKREITSEMLKKGFCGGHMEELPKDGRLEKVPVGNKYYRPMVHPLFKRDNESWKLLGKCLEKHISKVELYVAENGSNTCDMNMGLYLETPDGRRSPMFGYGLFIIPTPTLAKVNKDFRTILVENKWDEEDEEEEDEEDEEEEEDNICMISLTDYVRSLTPDKYAELQNQYEEARTSMTEEERESRKKEFLAKYGEARKIMEEARKSMTEEERESRKKE